MTYPIWLGAVKIEITLALIQQSSANINADGKSIICAANMTDEMEDLFKTNISITDAAQMVVLRYFAPNITQYEDVFCNIITRACGEDCYSDEIEAKIFRVIKHEEIKLWYKAKLSAQELAIKIMERMFTKEEMELVYFKDEFFGRVARMMERENNEEFRAEVMKATSELELNQCVVEKVYVKTFAMVIANKLVQTV